MHIKTVNKALAQAGIRAELVRGDGYFYFWGPDMDLARETGVYGVHRLNDLPLSLWIQEAQARKMISEKGI